MDYPKDRNGLPLEPGRFVHVCRGDRPEEEDFRGQVRTVEPDAKHGHVLTVDVWKGGKFAGRSRLTVPARAVVAPMPEALAEVEAARTRAKLNRLEEQREAERVEQQQRLAAIQAEHAREARSARARKAARTRKRNARERA
jgi:hypothetical protein